MTKRHIIAFLLGCVVAIVARNAPIKDFVRSVPRPYLTPRSINFETQPRAVIVEGEFFKPYPLSYTVSYTPPRAVIMEGEFPICSAVVENDAIYTARHCVWRKKEGDEVEVLLQKGSTPVRQTVYLQKVYSDIAILSLSKTTKVEPPKAVKVKEGTRIVAVMGILFANDPDVYHTSLPYFEREGKILAVFSAKEIGMTDLLPYLSPTDKFALLDIGSFGGNSGSGVYLIDKRGKRHLIGVVSAGVSDYTVVALF
jgi:hypothetical protein